MKLTDENDNTPIKTGPSAILTATNPTRTGLGLNLGLRGHKQVTNCLCHGTALVLMLYYQPDLCSHFPTKIPCCFVPGI